MTQQQDSPLARLRRDNPLVLCAPVRTPIGKFGGIRRRTAYGQHGRMLAAQRPKDIVTVCFPPAPSAVTSTVPRRPPSATQSMRKEPGGSST